MATFFQLEWEPLVRVGPFRFGQKIAEVKQTYKLLLVEEAAGEMQSDQYLLPGRMDVSIYVKEGRVDTISCRQEVLFMGHNLLYCSIEAIAAMLGQPTCIDQLTDACDDWEYRFEDLQLTAWGQRDSVFPYAIMVAGPLPAD